MGPGCWRQKSLSIILLDVYRLAVEFRDLPSCHPNPTLAVESTLRFPDQNPVQRSHGQQSSRFQNTEVVSWDPANIGSLLHFPDPCSTVIEPKREEILLLEASLRY